MAHNNNMNTCLIVGVIVVIALLVFLNNGKKESYSNIGDISNVGAFNDGYELVDSPEDYVNTASFADLVDSGDPQLSQAQASIAPRPAQRLGVQQGSQLLPRISKGVTPYNVDVADPITHSYMVNPPRVQLKDPLKLLADPYRGDIPIKYHPNVPLVNQSRYGRDSLRLDGFFSDHFKNLYNKYTGKGYKNMPMSIVNQEIIMDA